MPSLARFSMEAFRACGKDTQESRDLADDLQATVKRRLDPSIRAAFLELVERLNELGHNLSPYDDDEPSEISYHSHDPSGELGLRLSIGTVVSAGFAHLDMAKWRRA